MLYNYYTPNIIMYCVCYIYPYITLQVVLNDVVSLCPDSPDEPLYIARIIAMWEDSNGKRMFHGWWYR